MTQLLKNFTLSLALSAVFFGLITNVYAMKVEEEEEYKKLPKNQRTSDDENTSDDDEVKNVKAQIRNKKQEEIKKKKEEKLQKFIDKYKKISEEKDNEKNKNDVVININNITIEEENEKKEEVIKKIHINDIIFSQDSRKNSNFPVNGNNTTKENFAQYLENVWKIYLDIESFSEFKMDTFFKNNAKTSPGSEDNILDDTVVRFGMQVWMMLRNTNPQKTDVWRGNQPLGAANCIKAGIFTLENLVTIGYNNLIKTEYELNKLYTRDFEKNVKNTFKSFKNLFN